MASATAPAVRVRSAALVRAVPAWAWLAGLVLVSVLVRYAFSRRVVAPWIMGDELIYSELAKSLAEHGELRIRDQPVGRAFSVLYPLLIAPAYLLFESVPSAYAAAKAINGVLLSLVAVPTYLLARRLVPMPLALLAAGLSLAVPGALYAGMLMTENVFYPLVATFALALVAAAERPTPLRVLLALAVAGVAFLARAQAVVLLATLLTAPLLVVVLERTWLRGLRRFAWLYALPALALAALALVEAARGRSLLDQLGAYRMVVEEQYAAQEVARWTLWHVAHLDLVLGAIPLAALLVLVAVAPRLGPRERAFVAVAVALSAWMILQVATFASRWALRLEERNMFHLMPLFLVALVVWIDRGLPRPRAATAVAVAVAAALPLALPFERFLGPGNVSATSDTFGMLLWWDVWELGVSPERLWLPAFVLTASLALLFAFVPRGLALLLPTAVLVLLLVSTHSAEHRIRTASVGALFQGITHERRDWVDRAVGPDAEVAALWTSRRDWLTVAQNEFFSRSVGPVYALDAPLPIGLPQTPLELDEETGRLLAPGGGRVDVEYALVDEAVPVAGEVEAADRTKALVLLRPERPLRLEHSTSGVYGDRWTGPAFAYRRYECDGGRVRVAFEQDPNLIARPQQIVARAPDGTVLARGTVRPADERPSLLVPLRAGSGGTCEARFSVAPTAVPAGPDDERRLGIRVLAFGYEEP
jgi:hypothetical protein